MTKPYDYVDRHIGEEILDECPRCRLPIYASDPRRLVTLFEHTPTRLYHASCADATKGETLEAQLKGIVQELRGCGYVIELKLVRPVR